ncbi:MAG: helix-turn-helix transcriptional regulator [Elusimicrobiota bacterium]|jgi:hypothetical protein
MNPNKRRKLESKGWHIGTAKDFLELSEEEAKYIEFKLALAKKLRDLRIQRHMGQVQVAGIIKSSQSRVAKMEAADSSVSVDLIIRSFFSLGGSTSDLGRVLLGRPQHPVSI